MGSTVRSKGPHRSPIPPKAGVYPVSPPKKTARRSPRTTHELHRVLSRPNQRPEKCRASVHASVSPATLVVPSQSSSTTRAPGTPHPRRCSPTPSGTTNGAVVRRSSSRTAGRSRWS